MNMAMNMKTMLKILKRKKKKLFLLNSKKSPQNTRVNSNYPFLTDWYPQLTGGNSSLTHLPVPCKSGIYMSPGGKGEGWGVLKGNFPLTKF